MRPGLVSCLLGFPLGILIAAAVSTALPLSPAHADIEPAMAIGVDIPGGDFLSFPLSIPDPGLCRQECHRYNQCVAWTFVKPGVQGGQAMCWLKSSGSQSVANANAISGIKQSGWTAAPGSAQVTAEMELALDLPGGDIASFVMSNADPRLCQQQCEARGDCKSWTFVKPGVQNERAMCWLKGSVPGGYPGNQNVISGRSRGSGGGGGGGAGGGGGGGGTSPGGGAGEWGVWAYRAYGSDWGDPCSIQYVASPVGNPRYATNAMYRIVRTRPTQTDADLDIDHFGRFHRNLPDGVVKMVPCDPDGNNGGNGGGAGAGGGGGGGDGSHPEWMTGTFDTTYGVMVVSPGGGTYAYHDGTITVTKVEGDTMEGIWRQSGTGSCPGNTVWGHFSFTFGESGFSGSWGHCEDGELSRSWSGSRK